MKTRVRHIFLLFVAVAAILLTGSALWVFGTSGGARWLMREVSSRTSVRIAADKVEGGLMKDLRMGGVSVLWQDGSIRIRSLHFRLQPLRLLAGSVHIKEISLEGVDVRDSRHEDSRPPDLRWPKAPRLLSVFDAYVDTFSVKGFSYRRRDGEPMVTARVSLRLAWHRGVLAARDIVVRSVPGRLEGTISAGLFRPFLALDLAAIPVNPWGGIDRVVIGARLEQVGPPERMAGTLKVDAVSGQMKKGEFTSRLAIQKDSLEFAALDLKEPGRRGRLTGEGRVTFAPGGPIFRVGMRLLETDFSRELKFPTNLSGSLALEGGLQEYRGSFDLVNIGPSWQELRLSGALRGGPHGLEAAGLKGTWLGGGLTGSVKAGWEEAFFAAFAIDGRKLDPSLIAQQWEGIVNFDLKGEAHLSHAAPAHAELDLRLINSRLRGKSFKGVVQARLDGEDLVVPRLFLRGKGFDINVHGELAKNMIMTARVSDLSGVVPGAQGRVSMEGRLRLHEHRLTGSITGNGGDIRLDEVSIGSFNLSALADDAEGYRVKAAVSALALKTKYLKAESLALNIGGGIEDLSIGVSLRSTDSKLDVSLAGGYSSGTWKGRVTEILGIDPSGPWSLQKPAVIEVSETRIRISPVVLAANSGELLKAVAEISRKPLTGHINAECRRLNLSRLNGWLSDIRIEGQISGDMHVKWFKEGRMNVAAQIGANAKVTAGSHALHIRQAALHIAWNDRGLHSSAEIELDNGGKLGSLVTSAERASMRMPDRLDVETQWSGLDLLLFKSWLPRSLIVGGKLSGRVRGKIMSGRRFALEGNSEVSKGVISYISGKEQISVSLKTASLGISWSEKAMKGEIVMSLEEYGTVRGSFQIPLQAHLPASLDRRGAVKVSLASRVSENGILSSLVPGLIQESRGELDLSLAAGGTWGSPVLSGKMHLVNAGAYLPVTGTRLKNIVLDGHLDGDRIIVDSLRADSEEGSVEGRAVFTLRDWRIAGYQGTLKGRDFQAVYLPELQVRFSPELTFTGTSGELVVRGSVKIPKAVISQQETEVPVSPSRDVIIMGKQKRSVRTAPLSLDVLIDITLGDDVRVKASGLDGQLKGNLQLTATSAEEIKGLGEFHIEKGKFARYGAKLDIVKGRFVFSGGNVDNPALDVLALRTVGEVRAGVKVGGTMQNPVVSLYSEPSMPDTDILGYIVLGHPLSQDKEQAALMMKAAGLLLSSGSGAGLQEQIKNRLGLDTLDIESEGGAAGKEEAGGVARSLVTVGKYLTPKLYVSYGRSIFGDSNLFRMRYELSKHWEVETQSGTQSGADIYYKINFQ